MYKHRIAFFSAWAILIIALFILPGFEGRGLAMGLIIGYWPAVISRQILESQHHHQLLFLLMLLILSGTTVFLCAWLMDKAKTTKRIWALPFLSIIIGSVFFATVGLSFEYWKRTPEVSAAMESPEVSYKPTYCDFNKTIVIPRTLAGGLLGFYIATGICALASAIVLKRNYKQNKP